VRDAITGLSGVVVARTQHITGCDRYILERGLDKEGRIQDNVGLDGQRLILDNETDNFVDLANRADRSRGGPMELVKNIGLIE
jgi:hypothetical protein